VARLVAERHIHLTYWFEFLESDFFPPSSAIWRLDSRYMNTYATIYMSWERDKVSAVEHTSSTQAVDSLKNNNNFLHEYIRIITNNHRSPRVAITLLHATSKLQ
jgi:hypothetical protein